MITHKVEKELLDSVNSDIRNKLRELAEMQAAIKNLQGTMEEHEAAIDSPAITSFRHELNSMIGEISELLASIPVRLQKLAAVSEQTGRHLSALEEHSEAALLRGNVTAEAV